MGNVRYCQDNPDRFFEAEGKHEAIITEEEFTAAKILAEKRKGVSPTKLPADENYFAGLLHCGICGRKLVTHYNVKTRKGERVKTYAFQCLGRQVKACESKQITVSKLEKALMSYFSDMPDIAPDTESEETVKVAALAQIEALQHKITVLDAKEKEMLESYIADILPLAQYRDVKIQLDGERGKLLAEIERLTPVKPTYQGNMTKEEIAKSFVAEWQNFTGKERRQFLVNHISKITLINQPVKGTMHGVYNIIEIVYNV